jgi:hypothetical protein
VLRRGEKIPTPAEMGKHASWRCAGPWRHSASRDPRDFTARLRDGVTEVVALRYERLDILTRGGREEGHTTHWTQATLFLLRQRSFGRATPGGVAHAAIA